MSRILVIDDSELVSKLLKEGLTESGFEVAVALDANQGYSKALDFHPDLILLDVQLPDVTGFDLLRVLKNREQLAHTPIIMITGTHHQTENKVKGFQMGIDDYVMKPFEMPELVERIKAVLRRSASRRVEAPAPVSEMKTVSTPTQPKTQTREQKAQDVLQTVRQILLYPETLTGPVHLPGMSMAFLIAMLGLGLGGVLFAAGPAPKPAVVILAILGLWGILIAVLVMSSSLLGISLSWRDGSRLLALAGIPIVLKMTGALLLSIATTLSPYHFTAGPALFFSAPGWWLERIDLFEFWSLVLAWWLISRLAKSSRKKAWTIVGIMWGAVLLVSAVLARVGAKP